MTHVKIAGAPITWGISEVDGWGFQLDPERVLQEMRSIGLEATELGPDGFLPEPPAEKAAVLARAGLEAVGSFLPVVLFDDHADPLPRIRRELDAYAATGASTLILAAVTGEVGYDSAGRELSPGEWETLFRNLDRAAELASEYGVTPALHPHAGTLVEKKDEVQRVLDGSAIPFCFDTGHLMIGGTDPVAFARDHADRIAHTHLKDVSVAGIERVASGGISYFDATREGILYPPLGQGDVDVRSIILSLVGSGYAGWFVLEQDKVLLSEPAPGDGPVRDAAISAAFLRAVISDLPGTDDAVSPATAARR
ncbi:Inosose dehydratase [Microbacterium esteraromaticum]|uniref:Inosose dehydratase n=1 Tax=Microbacterium esteraromaticum TaxID=57043 RepID=A0A1R4K134_9MICO|nr:sugar phosphate isomerase/epimerase [Microbacterium esteraromaticum]SJN37775.1 Inosose dehydratase [Microbacterium esteraromaticum]